MSGIEPLIAAEAAAASAAAATTAAATAAATEMAAAAYASAVPALSSAAAGSQAAMLAAQTLPFGAGGLASTAAAGATPGTLGALGWNAASSMLNPATASVGEKAASQSILGQSLYGPETYANFIPGLTEAGPGSQAAMLSQQTGPFGFSGLTATGSAAAAPGTLSSTAWDLANRMALPGPSNAKDIMQGARLMLQDQQQGTRTNVAPPMLNKGRQVDLGSPIQGLLGGVQMPKRRRLSLI